MSSRESEFHVNQNNLRTLIELTAIVRSCPNEQRLQQKLMFWTRRNFITPLNTTYVVAHELSFLELEQFCSEKVVQSKSPNY